MDKLGLYYKPITIINDDSRVVDKLETSLTDDTTVIIYDHYMFIVQATGSEKLLLSQKIGSKLAVKLLVICFT